MPKSVNEIMSDRTADVVDGENLFTVNLPDWFPAELTREELDKLIDRFGADAVLYTLLAQAIIDIRAAARTGWGQGDEKRGKDNQLIQAEKSKPERLALAQGKVNEFSISLPKRNAGDPVKDLVKALRKLAEPVRKAVIATLDDEMRKRVLAMLG